MNNLEIMQRLSTVKNFKGVYPSDKVPIIQSGVAIINVDDSTKPGSHWVAVYYSPNGHFNTFFDSYGLPHTVYGLKLPEIKDHNTQQVQGVTSSVCGYYCIYYVLCKNMGKTMKQLLQPFTRNFARNDHLIVQLINLWTLPVFIPNDIICFQKCISKSEYDRKNKK